MDHTNANAIATLIKDSRLRKGYTQQELADLTGVSIRSIQRIENGEVAPRGATLRLLGEQLELKDITQQHLTLDQPVVAAAVAVPAAENTQPRNVILTISTGVFLILGTAAFMAQSPRFPETAFEALCTWLAVTLVYTVVLLRIWK